MIDSEHFTKIQSSLNLFYDKDSILRVKTRICGFEHFTYNKFPTLLKNDSYFTKLIVLKTHEDGCHSGTDPTLNFIRSNVWIIRDRQTVKKLLKSCFICKFVHGKTMVPPETPALPKFRVQCGHSFENIGADFAGPLYCKEKSGYVSKVYILPFLCYITRAVHSEITSSEGQHSLILAIRQFISGRGSYNLVISDNFKTFKSEEVKIYLRNDFTGLDFILDRSPWWGKFYKRLIEQRNPA